MLSPAPDTSRSDDAADFDKDDLQGAEQVWHRGQTDRVAARFLMFLSLKAQQRKGHASAGQNVRR